MFFVGGLVMVAAVSTAGWVRQVLVDTKENGFLSFVRKSRLSTYVKKPVAHKKNASETTTLTQKHSAI